MNKAVQKKIQRRLAHDMHKLRIKRGHLYRLVKLDLDRHQNMGHNQKLLKLNDIVNTLILKILRLEKKLAKQCIIHHGFILPSYTNNNQRKEDKKYPQLNK